MTEKYFYANPYTRTFEAQIARVSAEGTALALDRSLYYPGGGGQPCDLGWLTIEGERYPISEVYSADGLIWHKLDRAVPADFKGREVQGELDWERRYAHMRYHSALHVLNGVAFNNYGALVSGAQVYADRARIDFTMEDLAADKIALLEREANEAVARALPLVPREVTREEAAAMPELIRTLNAMPPAAGRIRILEIEGLDRQFCGGTHLSNTGEIVQIKIAGIRSKGKQNKRIEIVLESPV